MYKKLEKSLVSGCLLNKYRFNLVFELDKFVLTKGDNFVRKGYLIDGIFKLNINNNIYVSAYMLDSYSLWNFRLGHDHGRKIDEMISLNSYIVVI